MSRHDPSVSLRHMRDHAHELTDIMRGRSRADLDTDRLLALAVVRLLEIIGEAAARVPAEERTRRPGIRGRPSWVCATDSFTATTTSTTTSSGRL
jgi:uncharacterized protein with HEPN domain